MTDPQAEIVIGAAEDPLHALHWAKATDDQERAIVLVHDVFALDAHVRSAAKNLIEQGYQVLAPDLYSRDGLPEPGGDADVLRAAATAMPDRRAVRDIEAAGRWLLEQGVDPDGLAVMGFGRGGTLAFLAGCQSRLFQAVATFDGAVRYEELDTLRPVQPLEMALNLEAPLVAHFAQGGAGIPETEIEQLQAKLDAFAKTFEFHRYPQTAPGFTNPVSPAYHEAQATAAWERTFGFLDDVL